MIVLTEVYSVMRWVRLPVTCKVLTYAYINMNLYLGFLQCAEAINSINTG
jgi:hypothetical protein